MLTPKLKHVLHPFKTLNAGKRTVAAQLDMRRIAARADKLFRNDPRYNLHHVTAGFASREEAGANDSALLERICAAYIAAEADQGKAPAYEPTAWWKEVRERSLAPVIRALRTRDIPALQTIYANFFRNPCSSGLIGVPYGMTKAYFGQAMTDHHRRVYLYDVLHRLANWTNVTNGRFPISALCSPSVGNPFGVQFDETLIATHAEFRHYCAHRVGALLQAQDSLVFEIGGGFGGMAYYLLRDFPNVRYTNYDLPETIALASYYLIKALPERTFALYGESHPADVSLLPLWAMDDAPTSHGDVTFSSHAMSDLSPQSTGHYLHTIARITNGHFLTIGADRADHLVAVQIKSNHSSFKLLERRTSHWNAHRSEPGSEVELLYALQKSPQHHASSLEEHIHVSR